MAPNQTWASVRMNVTCRLTPEEILSTVATCRYVSPFYSPIMFIVVAGFVFQTAPRVHCKVSRWSSWKPCNVTCGRGVQLRGRAVIKKEMNDGIPCPHLVESRPCIQPNCSGRLKVHLLAVT